MDGCDASTVVRPLFKVGDRCRIILPGSAWDGLVVNLRSVVPAEDFSRPAHVDAFGEALYGFSCPNGLDAALPAECFERCDARGLPIVKCTARVRAPHNSRVCLTIRGEVASLKNSRRHVPGKSGAGRGYAVCLPSEKAERWMRSAREQVPIRSPLLAGPLVMFVRCFYASERPDLDESAVMDALQGRVYGNDRQIREKHVYHAIDKANPRVDVVIEPMQGTIDV